MAFEPQDDGEALGGVAIVVGQQDALAGTASPVRIRTAPLPADAAPAAFGSRTVNRLPMPVPALAASMRPPCSSTMPLASASPIPKPPAACSCADAHLREHAEHARQILGSDADAVVLDDEHQFLALLRAGHADRCRRGLVYLAALVSRFDSTCARRSGSPIHLQICRHVTVQLMMALVDERPRRLHRRAQDGLQIGRLLAQLQRAVRDARHVEQVVEQQRHVLHLALDDVVGPALLRFGGIGDCARSTPPGGWAPADCAAHAPASPGTRPCAGRLRRDRAPIACAA